MPVIAGRTREQIRGSIGYNLGAVWISTTTSGGNTTSVIDTALQGGTDDYLGNWVLITSGDRDGQIARVTAFDGAGNLTVAPALTGAPGSGVTYEMWEEPYNPRIIHDFINQAIMSVTGHTYNPAESLALHGDGEQRRFDIPSGFSMLNRIEVREGVDGIVLTDCDTAWTVVAGPVTEAVDSEVQKSGSALKFTVPVSYGAQEIAHNDITAVDISGMTHIECWIRSSIARLTGNNAISLGDGATQRELIDVPALAADTWTFIRLALTAFEVDTNIDEVRIINTDANAVYTLWLDDIRAVNEDSSEWKRLDSYYWRIDKSARDLVLINRGESVLGYNLMKLVGGDEPLLLTADTDTNEVDDQYVIAEATALALLSTAGGNLADPDNRRSIVGFWQGRAQIRRQSFPTLVDVRHVE